MNKLPADLPTNWQNEQVIAPEGTAAGLTPQHGYNYLMRQVNAAQTEVNGLEDSVGEHTAAQTGTNEGAHGLRVVAGAIQVEGAEGVWSGAGTKLPAGMITLWSGAVSAVPSGWVLCNGQNGTPDLRGRFIVGAGGSYGVGATGGVDSVTLSISQMPSHSHAIATVQGSPQTNGPGINGIYRCQYTSTDNTGGNGSHENRPPYYALCYIMFKG